LALDLGDVVGRARLMETRLGLKPDWGKLNVRNFREGAGNVTRGAGLRPAAKAVDMPPDPTVGAPALYPAGHVNQHRPSANWQQEEPMSGAKPFAISKQEVWKAYRQVKSNGGAAGVDAESIEGCEQDLKGNLYRLWNRIASGTYFPPPVREVVIPKRDGGERKLGIPTVTDRIAQTVVKRYLEPKVEPSFHGDSYGYRPGKSAVDAVGRARERCWQYDWVVDLDIRAFFDTLDHDLVKRAVRKYTDCRWVLLYVERWLTAPIQREDGTLTARPAGTPQGGVVSPLLANIFLHLAFDTWMAQTFPQMPFERYADDSAPRRRREEAVR
jgi:RNA-directed DNA polymerase